MEYIGKLKRYSSAEIQKSYVCIGFECLDRDMFNADKCYDLLGKSGVKYARCQTGWAKCEKEKGVYDFSWLDKIVDNLINRGVKPWFNVGFGNPLYMENISNPTAVGCVPLYYGAETISAWKSYVSALTEHFKDRITNYEIWNEADIKPFWYPETPDPKKYAELVTMTSDVIHGKYPDAKIGAVLSNFRCFDYIREMLKNIPHGELDFFSYHVYTKIPEHTYFENVKYLRKLFDECGFEKTEFWQGEGGYASWFPKGHWLLSEGGESERAQAVWQLRRYFLDIYAGVKLCSFFQMADMWERAYETATDVRKKPAAHGILNGLTYTPKLSYQTISNLATVFSGDLEPDDFYFTGVAAGANVYEQLSIVKLTFRKNNMPLYAYYLPSPVSDNREISYIYKAWIDNVNSEKLKEPVLIDTLTGEVYGVKKPTRQNGVCEYTELLLKDYPVILTDRSVFETE